MVKIEMPVKYWKALHRALDTASALMDLKFEKAFNSIVKYSYREQFIHRDIDALSKEIHNTIFGSAKIKTDDVGKKIKGYKKILAAKDGEYDFSNDDFGYIARALDLTIRVALGQWDELTWAYMNYLVDGERFITQEKQDNTKTKLAYIRNQMIPLFSMHNVHGSAASFGIYSPTLANEIGYMYGIYKAIKFATQGNPSDEEIVKNSDKPVSIIFPYDKSFVVESMEQVKAELENQMVPDYAFSHNIFVEEEDGSIYVYYRHGLAIKVDIGTKINICHNGWPEIERDGKIYNYRNGKNYFGY